MQYEALAIAVALIVFVVLWANITALFRRAAWRNRKAHQHAPDYFPFLAQKKDAVYERLWLELGDMLRLDESKLRPTDQLSELARLYPFPEMLYEDIEDFLLNHGVSNASLPANCSLIDIVDFAVDSQS